MLYITYGIFLHFKVTVGATVASFSTVAQLHLYSSLAAWPENKGKHGLLIFRSLKALAAMSSLHLLCFFFIFLLDPANKAMLEWSRLLQA